MRVRNKSQSAAGHFNLALFRVPVPTWYLAVSAVVAFVVTSILAYTTLTTARALRQVDSQDLVLLKSLGAIIHLDEVLTMSARMAALTGEPHWGQRYREAEPRLAAAIRTAQALAPGSRELAFVLATDEANQKLVAAEEQCLRLIDSGDRTAAAALVFSSAYAQLKEQYARGAADALAACERRVSTNLTIQRRAAVVNGIVATVLAIVGFTAVYLITRAISRRSQIRHELHVAMRRRTIDGLAATLAHELNQPLAAIANYCAAAQQYLAGVPAADERLVAAVDGAEKQALRAGAVIQRIRAFIAQDPPRRAHVNLVDVVTDAIGLVSREARHQNVAIEHQARAPVFVHGDQVELQQVVVNLLMNAINAARQAGDRRIVVATSADAQQADLLVRDNGPGVTRRDERHLFEAFHSNTPGGLGLGLAISREIVDAHGGRLTYERADGWTTFRVRLSAATVQG